ncbi:unnamed protein product [Cyprideis torosa]|uniref:Uncharacterized protein n=1 Tax=Cyprideis torosa TaxID=163714 RepID=A0A7R8ZSA8_9CRUS|nr:unnamed protein product [Cyprideis torosa]CAG0906356.1 unnamed protein product [Cyprideis torosa]
MSSYLMMKTYLWILVFGPCLISLDAIPLQRTDLEEEKEQVRHVICPDGFILLGDSCYAIGEEQYRTWDDSQTYCGSLAPGGKLIEIETAEEFYAVFSYLRENPPSCYGYWIGAEEREASNYFQWASTRWPVLFYNWQFNQPDASAAGNAIFVDCGSDWQWWDAPKSAVAYQLCEAPPTQEAIDSST